MPDGVYKNFVTVHGIYGLGSKEFMLSKLEKMSKAMGKEVETVKVDVGSVKRHDFKEGDFVSYGDVAFVAFPLEDLDLIGNVIKVSMLRSWKHSDGKEGEAVEGYQLVFEDASGDCMVIADCGPAKDRADSIKASVESMIMRSATPFGEF